jgi:hypothetical protein
MLLRAARWTTGAVPALVHAASIVVRALGRLLALSVKRALELVLALLFLFWEWGWRPLAMLLGRLARFRPWAMLEAWIADLPPYGALIVFGLPSAMLLPLKILAFWLIAKGHAITAAALLVAAKVVGTALVARIFLLTQPALMQLAWFARLYNWLVPWQEAIFATIRASWAWRYGRLLKARALAAARRHWSRWQPVLVARWQELGPRLSRLAQRARALGQRLIERLRALYTTNSSRP